MGLAVASNTAIRIDLTRPRPQPTAARYEYVTAKTEAGELQADAGGTDAMWLRYYYRHG